MASFPHELPASRVQDPRSAPSLGWGVLGTGWIAERFVTSVQTHSSQRIVAVGSRSRGTADNFAGRFGLRTAHDSYADLVADPAVEVVYVATPHNLHLEGALLALEAGKHVVVEKPIALTADEAREIAAAASSRGLFCMEAHWTTFLPKYDVLRQLVASDVLGEVIAVVADFGEWFPPGHRIFSPTLAGGPMHDLGTYLVSLAISVLGNTPDEVIARGVKLPEGVASQTTMLLRYGTRQAVLHTTISGNTPTAATIVGTRATIEIDGPFYQPGGFTLLSSDKSSRLRYDEPCYAHEGGLHFQAAEVARHISNGDGEATLRPLSTSIAVLTVMDEVRRQTDDLVPGER